VWGSTVSSPTGVWGEAPADFYYGAIWASQMASGDRIFLKIYVWKYQVYMAQMNGMEKRNFTNSVRNGGKTAEMRNNSAKSWMVGMSARLFGVGFLSVFTQKDPVGFYGICPGVSTLVLWQD